jgi:GxxExxY protein
MQVVCSVATGYSFYVNQITRCIVTAAMKVHSVLGPGLLKSAYQACLLHELRNRGLRVASQVGLPVVYDGEKIDLGYRIDLVVENLVIVEIKCAEAINPVHQDWVKYSSVFLCDLCG